MGWRRQFEHWRDRGHTWGPGIDERREPTESQIAESEAKRKAYEEKKNSIRVEPQELFIKQARQELRKLLPNNETSFGIEQPDRLGKYCDTQLSWATRAASASGYELKLHDETQSQVRDKNKFMIAVDYQGYIPERGGNIHKFSVVNIESINDCLQIFANLSALGYWPTTWFQDYHVSLRDSAELRLEMVSWGFPLEKENKLSVNGRENLLDKAKNLINAYMKAELKIETADYKDLRNVNLAFTETEDGKHKIQVDVNLIDFSIIKLVDKSVIEVVQYGSLAELINNELEGMSFDDLVYLTDGQLAPFYAEEKNKRPLNDVICSCKAKSAKLRAERINEFQMGNNLKGNTPIR